ncbi:hypothetical protein MUY27_03955 [Mucilaginibacter sp. RS28]|uniref:GH26 domain-containing protein n=1 Tax=Mucilaginibacter straminoryzae TaxID=2932774 RepID=A0A9X2BC19_9SPHI|nr:hypothetical protein [Mucilaginibacter straminoryzae]MCJ8208848.1 hypothetical protein [Mucilaginibacter straminoryzae]
MNSSKRSAFIIIVSVIVLLSVAAFYFKQPLKKRWANEAVERFDDISVGVFNRRDARPFVLPEKLAHLTLIWRNTALWNDDARLKEAIARGNVLVTIETWSNETWGSAGADNNVLAETLKGNFDAQINRLAAIAKSSGHMLLVRWNPDMEVPVQRYPWQLQSPKQYIEAFNYFSAQLKRKAPNVKLIWAPSGYPGDSEYWPDAKNVDLISITLKGTSEQMLAENPYTLLSAPKLLAAKLHHMRFMAKPVIILGSQQLNPSNFRQRWVEDFADTVQKYRNTIYSPGYFIESIPSKPTRIQLKVGVFDEKKRINQLPGISVEHIFTDWGEIQRGDFKLKFDSTISRKHDAIVTVEPWKDTTHRSDPNVLEHVVKGNYDKTIKKLFAVISNSGQTVYLRWAHEMEIPIHRYAWQSSDPITYINAFRHFMAFAKASNIRKVWGPAGDRGSADWFPGTDAVDFISIAIYGLPDKNITDYNRQESFATIFDRKNYRMRFLEKPFFITEFGIKGPERYQRKWLHDAASVIKQNKQVFGVCYFNLYDNPKAWGNIEAPDWSISTASMTAFLKDLNLQ